jgi:hypothetical protein
VRCVGVGNGILAFGNPRGGAADADGMRCRSSAYEIIVALSYFCLLKKHVYALQQKKIKTYISSYKIYVYLAFSPSAMKQ